MTITYSGNTVLTALEVLQFDRAPFCTGWRAFSHDVLSPEGLRLLGLIMVRVHMTKIPHCRILPLS